MNRIQDIGGNQWDMEYFDHIKRDIQKEMANFCN